jgi:hypothetical protein
LNSHGGRPLGESAAVTPKSLASGSASVVTALPLVVGVVTIAAGWVGAVGALPELEQLATVMPRTASHAARTRNFTVSS